jgi:hypothetical protein
MGADPRQVSRNDVIMKLVAKRSDVFVNGISGMAS